MRGRHVSNKNNLKNKIRFGISFSCISKKHKLIIKTSKIRNNNKIKRRKSCNNDLFGGISQFEETTYHITIKIKNYNEILQNRQMYINKNIT